MEDFLWFLWDEQGGELVAVLRGANAPMLQKMIVEELAKEKLVLEQGGERKVVSTDTLTRLHILMFKYFLHDLELFWNGLLKFSKKKKIGFIPLIHVCRSLLCSWTVFDNWQICVEQLLYCFFSIFCTTDTISLLSQFHIKEYVSTCLYTAISSGRVFFILLLLCLSGSRQRSGEWWD